MSRDRHGDLAIQGTTIAGDDPKAFDDRGDVTVV